MMFKLNQAALLFIELLVMCHVFEVMLQNENRAMMVPRGDSVTLTCNISKTNATQISWTNGRSVFQYSNRTYSNFSLHRLKINHELPTKLIIFSAQPEDEGIYACTITGQSGVNSITWNLTVSESPKAVFLYRKMMMRTLNQDPVQDQFPPHSGEEAAHSQPQGGTAHCTNNKRSSQYMERLNLIYGHF
ncbi:uncharacterized protein LOC120437062 isoform X2 [Oreochromis aureus]|uniref:uncharacterized protein LOC120437062 isoform X2 n=1 Tax=Oreochromis aureus TaxID=47969 RepID=UPI0019531035|nr:uncharacterized protein LOC120437062 isoform X2 [Oreochromis aureus]